MADEPNRQEWAAAFQRATWGCAPAVARSLGLSARAIEQWGHFDSGKRSPGERLEILIATALEHRKRHDALAPLHLLARRFGYVLEVAHSDKRESGQDVNRVASNVLLEASEAVQVTLTAIGDGLLSSEERAEIARECDEAMAALQRLKSMTEHAP